MMGGFEYTQSGEMKGTAKRVDAVLMEKKEKKKKESDVFTEQSRV